jgi:hypothetical protein
MRSTRKSSHRHNTENDGYNSDESFSPESVIFDSTEELSEVETEATDIDPLDEADCHVDVDDIPDLLCGAAHPPEYYRRIAEEVNDIDFDEQDYSPGTVTLIDAVEGHWQR